MATLVEMATSMATLVVWAELASRALLAEVAALVLVDRRHHWAPRANLAEMAPTALVEARMATRLATLVAMARRAMLASLAAMVSMGLEDRVDHLALRAEDLAGDPRCRVG